MLGTVQRNARRYLPLCVFCVFLSLILQLRLILCPSHPRHVHLPLISQGPDLPPRHPYRLFYPPHLGAEVHLISAASRLAPLSPRRGPTPKRSRQAKTNPLLLAGDTSLFVPRGRPSYTLPPYPSVHPPYSRSPSLTLFFPIVIPQTLALPFFPLLRLRNDPTAALVPLLSLPPESPSPPAPGRVQTSSSERPGMAEPRQLSNLLTLSRLHTQWLEGLDETRPAEKEGRSKMGERIVGQAVRGCGVLTPARYRISQETKKGAGEKGMTRGGERISRTGPHQRPLQLLEGRSGLEWSGSTFVLADSVYIEDFFSLLFGGSRVPNFFSIVGWSQLIFRPSDLPLSPLTGRRAPGSGGWHGSAKFTSPELRPPACTVFPITSSARLI